jgi:hypothetical protein
MQWFSVANLLKKFSPSLMLLARNLIK